MTLQITISYIVTVPTPIDDNKQPDLTPLKALQKPLADC